MSTTPRLPELPEPNGFAIGFGADVFSRPQVHAIQLATWKAAIQHAAEVIPTDWLDNMLTGKGGLGQPPYSCPDIEKLLTNLRAAILALPLPEQGSQK